MEADVLAAAISSRVRVLRATRALSQRELAIDAGVTKSALGRIEAAELPAAVRTWLTVLDRLGVAVTLEPDLAAAAVVELDAYRDLAGRGSRRTGWSSPSGSPPTGGVGTPSTR